MVAPVPDAELSQMQNVQFIYIEKDPDDEAVNSTGIFEGNVPMDVSRYLKGFQIVSKV